MLCKFSGQEFKEIHRNTGNSLAGIQRFLQATPSQCNDKCADFGLSNSQGKVCNGKWNGMERKFRYGIGKMLEWNGRFQEWNGRQSPILPYQFHTRFHALFLQKNTYRCRVVINNTGCSKLVDPILNTHISETT